MANQASKSISAEVNPDYTLMQPYLKSIRDCMIGSPAIKHETYTYLPHPSQIDMTSDEQRQRYVEFLAGAEFDGFPDETRRELLGKMRISDSKIEFNGKAGALDYLIDDFDGNGVSLDAAIEYAISNVYQTKWHLLVADVRGAPVSAENMSKADVKALNIHAVGKQYTRENIVNWNFSKSNGIEQLTYLLLLEVTYDFDQATGQREEVQNYLTLALDENGDYYQVKSTDGNQPKEEDRNYVSVGGQPLKRLPVQFIADEELADNCLPLQLGYLWSVCDASLNRYRISAYYKETMTGLLPTMFTSGWTKQSLDLFKELNNNRTFMVTGAGGCNNLPDGVTVDSKASTPDLKSFENYFEANEKKIRSLGGTANTQSVAMTATEADINASKQNSLMNTVADNSEDSFKKTVFWQGVLTGVYTQDEFDLAMEEIVIELPRDFATPKLSADEHTALREDYMVRAITKEMYISELTIGGILSGDVETILAELEETPPAVVVTPQIEIDGQDSQV